MKKIKLNFLIKVFLCSLVMFSLISCSAEPSATENIQTEDIQTVGIEVSQPSTGEGDAEAPSQINEVHVPVLYYHSILVEPNNPVRIPPEQFEEQMRYLSENGYHSITPDQLYNDLFNGGTLPERPVLITFDDGYVDNYTKAFPIMKKYNLVGTIFVVGNYINSSGFLTAAQLNEMQSAGWTIGGHTANHVDLSKESLSNVVDELQSSRRIIENYIGQPLKYFCYPFGGFSPNIIEKVKNDGYIMAFTTEKGWVESGANPYAFQRVYLYPNMGMKEFINRLTNPQY